MPAALAAALTVFAIFTVDGHRVRADRTFALRPGQVLAFPRRVQAFTLTRLECKPAVAHAIRLPQSRKWRVPDLAEGAYSISGRGFDQLVRVRNHAAPCPG